MSKIILIYITNPTKQHAIEIAKHLLDKNLIACGNIFLSDTFYVWKGKLEETNEHILIAKTTKEKFEKTRQELEKIHPYETPCILKIEAEANKSYFDWIKTSIK